MKVDLRLSSEEEDLLRSRAAGVGQDVEGYIHDALVERLSSNEVSPAPIAKDIELWRAKLQACIQLHPAAAHFVDDSRESIYADRGG